MEICTKCAKEFNISAMENGYCKSCIEETEKEQTEKYEQEMLEAFIGKVSTPDKYTWYKKSFSKFNTNGLDTIKWNWSWWAFLGGVFFLFYRKAYVVAAIVFVIILLMPEKASVLISILLGGYSTYFVYREYTKKKKQIENTIEDRHQRVEAMKLVGGSNDWAKWSYLIVAILFILSIIITSSEDTDNKQTYQRDNTVHEISQQSSNTNEVTQKEQPTNTVMTVEDLVLDSDRLIDTNVCINGNIWVLNKRLIVIQDFNNDNISVRLDISNLSRKTRKNILRMHCSTSAICPVVACGYYNDNEILNVNRFKQ